MYSVITCDWTGQFLWDFKQCVKQVFLIIIHLSLESQQFYKAFILGGVSRTKPYHPVPYQGQFSCQGTVWYVKMVRVGTNRNAPICTNMYQSVPQYSWYSLVQIGTCWYRLVQVDTNIISYLYQPVPTCINLYHYIAGTGWYRLVQIGTDWYRLVQLETGWYRLVQLGKDLKHCPTCSFPRPLLATLMILISILWGEDAVFGVWGLWARAT